ncbi:MAG: PKD domain-containing protein [Schleiferiaceae bacterium]
MKNYIFAICAFCSLAVNAQWTPNTALNTLAANVNTDDMMTAATNDGRTYIAFWAPVSGPTYYELRLQLLDTSGTPQFGPNGMIVDNTIGMSTSTSLWDMAVDNTNNVYLGITGTGGNGDARVHKVSPSGTKQWGTNGITLGQGYCVRLLPLASGDLITAYLPASHAVIQKYSSTGVAQWTTPITVTPTVSSHQSWPGEFIEMSNSKFMFVFHDKAGFSPSALPYAHCYSTAGTAVWTSPVALSSGTYTYAFNRYDFIQRGDTAFFGYGGAQGMNLQSFIQRINPDGTLPWGANGVDFGTQNTLYERNMRLARGDDSKYLWAIAEMTTSSQGNMGESVQKLHAHTGARLLGTNAQVVYTIGTSDISHRGHLQVWNDHPVFLVSDGNSNGVFPKDLLLVELDTLGNFLNTPAEMDFATNSNGTKSRIDLLPIHNGLAIGAWVEDRTGNGRPYAQMVDINPCLAPTLAFQWLTSNTTLILSNASLNADSIYWDFGDGSGISDTSSSIQHVFSAPGTYTICGVAFNACSTDSLCATITVCDALSAAFSATSFLDSAHFTLSSAVYYVYWDFGDGQSLSTTDSTASHVYASNGTYSVSCLAYNACATDSTQSQVVISGIGVPETDLDAILLLQNGDRMELTSPNALLLNVQMSSVDGRVLWSSQPSSSTVSWSRLGIPAGIYVIRAETSKGQLFVEKLHVR